MTTYTYSISGDITSQECKPSDLWADIMASTLSQTAKDALRYVIINPDPYTDPDRLDVDFPGHTLTSGDETILDAVVAATKIYDWRCCGYSRVSGYNGVGSTNDRIARWDTVEESDGGNVVYTDSATDGGYWTVQQEGTYSVSVWGLAIGSGTEAFIGVDSALNNTYAESRCRGRLGSSAVNDGVNLHWEGHVDANDKIWLGFATSDKFSPGSDGGVTITQVG